MVITGTEEELPYVPAVAPLFARVIVPVAPIVASPESVVAVGVPAFPATT